MKWLTMRVIGYLLYGEPGTGKSECLLSFSGDKVLIC